jgi:hypothetical protein
MRTINKLVFVAMLFVAVGICAVASIKVDAAYNVPAGRALQQTDLTLLTLSAGDLPVQQFDAF